MRTRSIPGRARTATLGALVLGLVLLLPGQAAAQGDGPHNLPLIPINTNIFTPQVLVLSGNFNPQGTILVPGANIDVIAVPITYIRTFALGSRFGRLFLVAPISTLDASVAALDPLFGVVRTAERRRSGFMDPMVTMHIGLVGAPALKLGEFVKFPKAFQMVAILGTSIPLGTYDSARLINLGTNRWSFRTGVGTVFPFGEKKRTALEMSNNLYFFTANNDVSGPANDRSQDPLYVLENHLTHNFTPKVWGSLEARYQYRRRDDDRREGGRQRDQCVGRRILDRLPVHAPLRVLDHARHGGRQGRRRQRKHVQVPDRLLVLVGERERNMLSWYAPKKSEREMKSERSEVIRRVGSAITRRQFTTMVATPMVLGIATSAAMQRGGWEQLGTKEIEGRIDHDKIKCHGNNTYRALQFRVTGAAVQFDRVQVEYGNHKTRVYPFRMLVPPNGASPVLDLVGGDRDITNVEFWYEKASWGKKPEVRLYGRK